MVSVGAVHIQVDLTDVGGDAPGPGLQFLRTGTLAHRSAAWNTFKPPASKHRRERASFDGGSPHLVEVFLFLLYFGNVEQQTPHLPAELQRNSLVDAPDQLEETNAFSFYFRSYDMTSSTATLPSARRASPGPTFHLIIFRSRSADHLFAVLVLVPALQHLQPLGGPLHLHVLLLRGRKKRHMNNFLRSASPRIIIIITGACWVEMRNGATHLLLHRVVGREVVLPEGRRTEQISSLEHRAGNNK